MKRAKKILFGITFVPATLMILILLVLIAVAYCVVSFCDVMLNGALDYKRWCLSEGEIDDR